MLILSAHGPLPIVLQCLTSSPVVSGTVRVDYFDPSFGQTNLFVNQALTQLGSTNQWQYAWYPFGGLGAFTYWATYAMTDSGGNTWTALEDIVVPDDLVKVREFVTNKWSIDPNTAVMTFYGDDQTTPIFQVNLLDAFGNPTSTNPYQRVPT